MRGEMNRRVVYRGSGFIEKIKKKYDISHHAFVLELGRMRFDGTGEEILNNAKLRKVYLGGKFISGGARLLQVFFHPL